MITDYILIQLNGKPFNCPSSIKLKDVLLYLGYALDSIVVEYNAEILHDLELSTKIIKTGDKIEILTIVGGG